MKEKELSPAEKKIQQLYVQKRESFINYFRYSIKEEVLEDIYQDSWLTMQEKMKEGRLITDTISSYFWTIYKNKVTDYWNKYHKAQNISIDDILHLQDEYAESILEKSDRETAIEVALELMKEFPEKHKTILRMSFFGPQKTSQEIADAIGHESVESARSEKSRCIKKMRTKLTAKLKILGITIPEKENKKEKKNEI